MPERGESVERGVGPVPFTLAIDAVRPPRETVASAMIGLVVPPADGPLAGNHLGLFGTRSRKLAVERASQHLGHELRVEDLPPAPVAALPIKKPEPRHVAHRSPEPAGTFFRPEDHK